MNLMGMQCILAKVCTWSMAKKKKQATMVAMMHNGQDHGGKENPTNKLFSLHFPPVFLHFLLVSPLSPNFSCHQFVTSPEPPVMLPAYSAIWTFLIEFPRFPTKKNLMLTIHPIFN